MPLKAKVAYSKEVRLPNKKTTLALFDKQDNLLEYRICKYNKSDKKYICPKRQTEPEKRKSLAKQLGINSRTNQLLKR